MPSIDDLPPPVTSPARSKASIDDLPSPNADTSGVINQVRGYFGKPPLDWNAVKDKGVAIDAGLEPRPALVAGTPPLVAPVGALGALGKAAVALSEGSGLGYAAGRTALSAGQGAVMSALDGKEGESLQDKIDRAKSGAKLSGGIQLAAESLPYIGKGLGFALKKGGELMSGENGDLIANYAKNTDAVNDIIKESGGDPTAAADNVRTELSKGIQSAKAKINGQISSALEQAPSEASIPAQPMIERLESAKAKLNPNYKSEAIADIDEMIGKIKAQATNGMLDPKGLYETKQFLNENAKGSFQKGGQIFTRASESARAARDASADARSLIRDHLPEIADADAELSKMHAIEGRLNKNLLAPGTPDGALLAAGSGANPRNAANLRKLEEISGVPVARRAMDLATAKSFASPQLLPKDFTGKAAARLMVGAGLGAGLDSDNRGEGALVGGMLASPMAVKGIINAANLARKAGASAGIPQVAQAIRQNPFAAQTIAQLAARQVRRANDDNPMNGGTNEMQAPQRLMQAAPNANRSPARGEEKWAQDGAANLGVHGSGMTDSDLQSLAGTPKGKQLLIQASDLKPGSKAMQKIYEQAQSLLKGAK